MFCGDKEWTFGLIAKVCGCGYGQWMTCGVVTVDDEGDWCIFYFIFFLISLKNTVPICLLGCAHAYDWSRKNLPSNRLYNLSTIAPLFKTSIIALGSKANTGRNYICGTQTCSEFLSNSLKS
jgi:hypothetical protein